MTNAKLSTEPVKLTHLHNPRLTRHENLLFLLLSAQSHHKYTATGCLWFPFPTYTCQTLPKESGPSQQLVLKMRAWGSWRDNCQHLRLKELKTKQNGKQIVLFEYSKKALVVENCIPELSSQSPRCH